MVNLSELAARFRCNRGEFLIGAGLAFVGSSVSGCAPASSVEDQVAEHKQETLALPPLVSQEDLQSLIDTGEGMVTIIEENKYDQSELMKALSLCDHPALTDLEKGELHALVNKNANLISGLAGLIIYQLKQESLPRPLIDPTVSQLNMPAEVEGTYQEKVYPAQKLIEGFDLAEDLSQIPDYTRSSEFLFLLQALGTHTLRQTIILECLSRTDSDIVSRQDALNSARHALLFGNLYEYFSLSLGPDGQTLRRNSDWGIQLINRAEYLIDKLDPEFSDIQAEVYPDELLYSTYIDQAATYLSELNDNNWRDKWQQFLAGLLEQRQAYLRERYGFEPDSQADQLLRQNLESQNALFLQSGADFVNRQLLPSPIEKARISMDSRTELLVKIGDIYEEKINVTHLSTELTALPAYLRSAGLTTAENLRAQDFYVLERDGKYHLALALLTPTGNTVYYLLDYRGQIFDQNEQCLSLKPDGNWEDRSNLVFDLPPQNERYPEEDKPLKIVYEPEEGGFAKKFFYQQEAEILVNGLTVQQLLGAIYLQDIGSWGELSVVPFTNVGGFYHNPEVTYDYWQVAAVQPGAEFVLVRVNGRGRASIVDSGEAEIVDTLGTIDQERLIPIPTQGGTVDASWQQYVGSRPSAANPDAFLLVDKAVSDNPKGDQTWLAVRLCDVKIHDFSFQEWLEKQATEWFVYNGLTMFPDFSVMGKVEYLPNPGRGVRIGWVETMGGWNSPGVTMPKPVKLKLYVPISRPVISAFWDMNSADYSRSADGVGPVYTTATWLSSFAMWSAAVAHFNDRFLYEEEDYSLNMWTSLTNQRYSPQDIQENPDIAEHIILVNFE